jgi:hypothetical protein
MKKLLAITMAALVLSTVTASSHGHHWPCNSYAGACHGPVAPG